MTNDFKKAGEQYFLQGLSSAKGGLPQETCPYSFTADQNPEPSINGVAAVNWRQGWQFGKFVVVQKLRKEKFDEIKAAISHLLSYQDQYAEGCCIVNQGLFKSGLKYFAARRKSNEIARYIRRRKEYQLLKDVWIDFYIPWRHSEAPYSFRLYDRRTAIVGENNFRELVSRYGESHGVLAEWREYLASTPIENVLTPDDTC